MNPPERLHTKATSRVTFQWPAALLSVFALAFAHGQAPTSDEQARRPGANAGGGPPGGQVVSLVIDPRSDETLYVSLLDAGIFKTVDAGGTWTEIGPDTPWSVAWFNLVFDPANPGALYAENLGTFYVTTDGGASWRRVTAVPSSLHGWPPGDERRADAGPWPEGAVALWGKRLVVGPWATRGTAYAGTASGLLKTTDNGLTWQPANTGLSGIWSRVLAVVSGDQPIVIVESGSRRPYRSADGGDSWAPVGLPAADDSDPLVNLVPGPAGTLYARTRSRVFRSTDAGTTWSAFSADWQDLRLFAFGPAGSATVYATTEKGLVKSVDGGIRWTPMTTGLPAKPLYFGLWVDPIDPSRLYASTFMEGVYRSLDGGANWTALTPLPRYAMYWEVLPNPDARDVIYLFARGVYIESSEGDIFRTTDGGRTWTRLTVTSSGNMPMDFLALVPSHPATLFAGAYLRGNEAYAYALFRSTDQGATWTRSDTGLPPAGPVTSLLADPADPRRLFAGTGRGVFRSSDGGEHWQPTNAVQASSSGAQLRPPIDR